uniref:Uncharacterized protein n=1 Tax=Avena sativa TaxID=4498 RepID=A0ACD5ZI21_AVESA
MATAPFFSIVGVVGVFLGKESACTRLPENGKSKRQRRRSRTTRPAPATRNRGPRAQAVCRLAQANEKAAIYKNKVIHNWNEICIIYSKDHATGQGARTGVEADNENVVIPPARDANDISPDFAGPSAKRSRQGDAIMCMLGEVRSPFNDAMKSTELLQIPHVTPPSAILAAVNAITDLSHTDKLRAYGKLIHDERSFLALMELPVDFRKEWLLMMMA